MDRHKALFKDYLPMVTPRFSGCSSSASKFREELQPIQDETLGLDL